jgi:hypothetical protein
MKPLDRILLLLTTILASYQVVSGVEGTGNLAIVSYTIGFGVLVVAGLLLIILGFEVLDSPLVVIASTIIPLGLSLGLVAEHYPGVVLPYAIFAFLGFTAIILTRLVFPGQHGVFILMVVHGVAGLIIFLLPIIQAIRGEHPAGFALVGLGGALMGIGGLLLSFLKGGKPLLSREKILAIFPTLLLLTTAAFVFGFSFV